MSLYTKIVSGVLFPLQEGLKSHSTLGVRREMERTQWYSQEKIKNLQIQKSKKFLEDIGQNVPFYRRLFKQIEFDPETFNSINDLQKLPLMAKPDIRAANEQLKADDAVGLARFTTGGSTGEPLVFYLGSQRVSHDVAAKWRATRWWGVDIGDPEIVVWGSPVELGAQDRFRQARDFMFRSRLLSAFEISKENLDQFLDTIKRVKPRILFGYPSALSQLAEHAKKNNLHFDNQGIRVAFVTAERLYDHQRESIESTFGCSVANGYGGRDAGFVAHECPSGKLHITSEDIIVEIINEYGKPVTVGSSGEIVVTHLASRDYPFVRYRTGDVGSLTNEQCSCGRGLLVMREVEGRSSDYVKAMNGTVMHGAALNYILRDITGIDFYKIVQETLELIRVEIVVGEQYDYCSEERIIKYFKKRLGQEVEVQINYLDKINPEKSGKYRYVISKVMG